MPNRISRVQARLEDLEGEALLLTSLPNIRWACGFTGSNGLLLVASNSAHFISDGRYTDQAKEEVEGARVHIADNGVSGCLEKKDLLEPFNRVVFQSDDLTVAKQEELTEKHGSVEWVPVTQVLTRQVASKEDREVDRIRVAQSITESVFDSLLDLVEPGMTERDVAAAIVYRHLKRGADSMSFNPIVASGPNGARPHGRPTDRTLREGELVVVDMGCYENGYASDMTRTIALGEPGAKARAGYDAVLRAQQAALDAAQAGMTGKELDAVARDKINDAGFGEAFSHGLGHGVGLEVHEWPRVSRTADEALPEGACVTIEPGVYVPEENFGVRIEDIVVLRSDGSENLTRSPKELMVL